MSADTVQQAQRASQRSADQVQPAAPAQKASAVSSWLNRVFIVAILIAIPLLYYFGYIDVVSLNRIGIILNFCAGFMLAPDLLGEKRLQFIEEFTEKRSLKISKAMSSTKQRLRQQLLNKPHIFLTIFIAEVTVIVLFFWHPTLSQNKDYINVIVCQFMLVVAFTIKLIRKDNKITNYEEKYTSKDAKYALLKLLVIIILRPILLFLVSVYLYSTAILLVIITVANSSAEFIIRRLRGDAKLRLILIWWGIIFFIVGNLLQFISTF